MVAIGIVDNDINS